MILTTSPEFKDCCPVLEGVRACAGLRTRSQSAPRRSRASAKHSVASEHVIPPDHRHLYCVVSYIPYIQWISMKINENQRKSMKIIDFGQITKIQRLVPRVRGCPGLCGSLYSFLECSWVLSSLCETFRRVRACHPSRSSTSLLCSNVYTIYTVDINENQ